MGSAGTTFIAGTNGCRISAPETNRARSREVTRSVRVPRLDRRARRAGAGSQRDSTSHRRGGRSADERASLRGFGSSRLPACTRRRRWLRPELLLALHAILRSGIRLLLPIGHGEPGRNPRRRWRAPASVRRYHDRRLGRARWTPTWPTRASADALDPSGRHHCLVLVVDRPSSQSVGTPLNTKSATGPCSSASALSSSDRSSPGSLEDERSHESDSGAGPEPPTEVPVS